MSKWSDKLAPSTGSVEELRQRSDEPRPSVACEICGAEDRPHASDCPNKRPPRQVLPHTPGDTQTTYEAASPLPEEPPALRFENDEMRCPSCDKQTPHRLFGDTWRCSECGEINSVCCTVPPASPETQAELTKALDYPLTALEFHGCLTGDCPHNHGNHCVESLAEHIREMVAELRTAHSAALALFDRQREERDHWKGVADRFMFIGVNRGPTFGGVEFYINEEWRNALPVPRSICALNRITQSSRLDQKKIRGQRNE